MYSNFRHSLSRLFSLEVSAVRHADKKDHTVEKRDSYSCNYFLMSEDSLHHSAVKMFFFSHKNKEVVQNMKVFLFLIRRQYLQDVVCEIQSFFSVFLFHCTATLIKCLITSQSDHLVISILILCFKNACQNFTAFVNKI